MCYDISAGCSGFVYGIITACHLIDSGFCSKGLVIGAEKFSRVVDPDDPGTAILFGDGAGAVVVGKVPAGYGLMASDTGSDGSQFEAAWIPGGMGSRPAPAGCPARHGSHLRMDGHLVFEFAMRTIGDSVRRLLDSISLNISDVNLLIPHQANQRIVEAAAGRINFPMKNVFLCLDKCGNTSAASIPIAIHYALAYKRIYHKSIVALVGFGGGLSWGSCLYCWYNPEFVHHKN
jgi:3-oxoacyl-[acyl-carrier-protein] synthase-3